MRHRGSVMVVIAAVLSTSCSHFAPVPERPVDWRESSLAVTPTTDFATQLVSAQNRPARGKFSVQFYERLRARPAVAALAQVDVWELRRRPRRHDIITIGPTPIGRYSGRRELLDQLAATDGLSPDKAQVLLNWVRTGGVLWIEFGVTVQGHEWVNRDARTLPPLPDLTGFTMLGLPTHAITFEAKRTGPFTFEPTVFPLRNEASHPATADVKSLSLTQSNSKTAYLVLDAAPGQALILDGTSVYATVVPFERGKVISTIPFDQWAAEDGEKFRINLFEWLAGYPIPTFDPTFDVDRNKD